MKELIEIQNKLNAPKSLRNSFGNYNYRSAETILESVKPLLKEHNCILLLSDEIVNLGNRYYIKAIAELTNSEGIKVYTTGFAREEETKKGMDGSQITGASSSYARKYALNGLFAIDDEKDSDSTNTHGNDKKESKPKDNFKSDGRLEITEYIEQVKQENDVNSLTPIYNEFNKFKWSEKQVEWFMREIKARKETLLSK